MTNHTAVVKENATFLITCNIAENPYQTINRFPNKKYEREWIAMLVVAFMLLFSTIILNGISIVAIRKSSQLRSKICYFVILLQTNVDFGVGVLSIPIFIYQLLSPFLSTDKCTLLPWVMAAIYIPCALSIVTQSAMSLERYIGVLHPYYYEAHVTKKRILAYVCGSSCAIFTIICSGDRTIVRSFWGLMILAFFFFTAFVYTRIYFVIRKLIRSEKKPASCDSSDSNETSTKRQMFRESRHARSCFAVVVCFGIFLLPLVLGMIFVNTSSTIVYLEYVHWSMMSMIFNSTINSLIFFWTKPLLRKEAFKTLGLCKREGENSLTPHFK